MVSSTKQVRRARTRSIFVSRLVLLLLATRATGLVDGIVPGMAALAGGPSFLERHPAKTLAATRSPRQTARPAARIRGEAGTRPNTSGANTSGARISRPARLAERPKPVAVDRWVSDYDAQVFAGAPITQPALLRNYGALEPAPGDRPDLSPRRTSGSAGSPEGAAPIDTTLYGAYYNPSFVGYGNQAAFAGRQPTYNGYGNQAAFGGRYASYSGYGYGGFPVGWTNYPPWRYRPRYFYPYRYYPLRTGFSVYNPQFFYNNTWYGRYANPFWSGYGGFGFPYHFGGLGPAGGGLYGGLGSGYGGLGGYGGFGASSSGMGGYGFGGFGYPYRYGVFGYPYPSLARSVHNYLPSFAYFMYPGMGGLYVPPGFWGFPGYYGYAGYGLPVGSLGGGGFYW